MLTAQDTRSTDTRSTETSLAEAASFDKRFELVVAKMRRTRVSTIVCFTIAAVATCVLMLAIADYFLELNWLLRATLLIGTLVVAVAFVVSRIARTLRYWNRRVTAAHVEQRFQDLGQAVRTTVQFRDTPFSPGTSPALLQALNADVQSRTEELRLSEVIPTGPLKLGALSICGLGTVLVVALLISWDWRMAIQRSLLGNASYTNVIVPGGDLQVAEKGSLTLSTEISGRTNRNVALLMRELPRPDGSVRTSTMSGPHSAPADSLDSEQVVSNQWVLRPLGIADETSRETRRVSYRVDIPRIREPFEYKFVAGTYESPVHRVDVKFPPVIQQIQVEVDSPPYTRLAPKKFETGSFDGVQGATARLTITFDNPPKRAWIELSAMHTPDGEEPEHETIPLEANGSELTTSLALTENYTYQVFAESYSGVQLRPNRFRIRVYKDRPPRITFRRPEQLIEVHSLAEILMQLKASDDFGLTRVGIRLQKNNEPEITLEDLPVKDLHGSDGRLTPQTQKLIESLVPLEYFELGLRDSISYYGFAEDSFPDGPQSNETDLQFIDIRSFRQLYPVPDPKQNLTGMGRRGGTNQRSLPALDEMISRERFVTNRTRKIGRIEDRGEMVDAGTVDQVIGMQNETSEFAGRLGDEAVIIEEQEGIEEDGRISDLLYAAQDDMLASVDSLASSEWEIAELQEKDALQHLLDARTRLEQASNNGGGGGFAAFQMVSARLRNRIRRPSTDQEKARDVVRRLRKAAAQQEFLMESISDLVPPEMPNSHTSLPEPEDPKELAMDAEAENDGSGVTEEVNGMSGVVSDDSDETAKPTLNERRREIEREQLKIADEFSDIANMIEQLNLSPLTQRRTEQAAENLSSLVGSMERRETELAIETAARVSIAFRNLAKNISGITAEEAAKRLEIARNMGMLLTDDLQDLESRLDKVPRVLSEWELDEPAAAAKEAAMARSFASQAQQKAEIAQTIGDILNSITDPERGITDPEDAMVKRLQEIMAESEFVRSSQRLSRLADSINDLRWSDAVVEADDLGDRFDIVSQRLDAMHREILAPRIEQLRELELRASEAREQLSQLLTADHVDRWHVRAEGLLKDITTANVAANQVASVRTAIEQAGWGTSQATGFNSDSDGISVPDTYPSTLTSLIDELRLYIQELTMLDTDVANSGAVPPQYRQFVERYFEVISGVKE